MGFTLTSESAMDYTQIPDLFIQKYMPSADGNFVKVYLFLLMFHQHPTQTDELSASALADCLECTEKDVIRALHYWEKRGLLSLQEHEGEIVELSLHIPGSSDTRVSSPVKSTGSPVAKVTNLPPTSARFSDFSVPKKQTYTPLQAEALTKDAETNRAIDAIEQLLGEPVSPAHLQTILYFLCDVGFSTDLIITLYKVATAKGKKKPSYIEAIGISWASQGIKTPEEAENESLNFSGRYALVAKAFGIRDNLKPAQREVVDSWNVYHFADSIIAEACKRTILQTGDANFQYTSKILENWHKNRVNSLQDIEKCDASYKKEKKNSGSVREKNNAHKNSFQKFPQRSYSRQEYDSLEKQLLRGKQN